MGLRRGCRAVGRGIVYDNDLEVCRTTSLRGQRIQTGAQSHGTVMNRYDDCARQDLVHGFTLPHMHVKRTVPHPLAINEQQVIPVGKVQWPARDGKQHAGRLLVVL